MLRQRTPARLLARGTTLSFTLGVVARLVLLVFGSLLVWASVPALIGWSPHVVLTGSMEPRIQPGDVVVTGPLGDIDLRAGHVVAFTGPAEPHTVFIHRIADVNDDGTFVTRGDANPTADSDNVGAEDVRGIARLRVPFAGLPAVWVSERQIVPLVLAGGGLMLAAWLVRRERAPRGQHRTSRSTQRRATITSAALVALLAAGWTLGYPGAPAISAFAGTSTSPGNSWQAGTLAPPTDPAVTASCTAAQPQFVLARSDIDGPAGANLLFSLSWGAVQPGDLLIAFIAAKNQTPFADGTLQPVTADTVSKIGWQRLGFQKIAGRAPGSEFASWVFAAVAPNQDPGFATSWNIGGAASGVLVVYRNVSIADVTITAARSDVNSAQITVPSIYIDSAPATQVGFAAIEDRVAGGHITGPAGWTQREESLEVDKWNTALTRSVTAAGFDRTVAAAGPTGDQTFTANGVSKPNMGFSLALGVSTASLSWVAPSPAPAGASYAVTRTGWVDPEERITTSTTLVDRVALVSGTNTWTVRTAVGSWRSASIQVSASCP